MRKLSLYKENWFDKIEFYTLFYQDYKTFWIQEDYRFKAFINTLTPAEILEGHRTHTFEKVWEMDLNG